MALLQMCLDLALLGVSCRAEWAVDVTIERGSQAGDLV